MTSVVVFSWKSQKSITKDEMQQDTLDCSDCSRHGKIVMLNELVYGVPYYFYETPSM